MKGFFMTKQNNIIVITIILLILLHSGQQIWAGSDTKNGYTLTVSKADPAYTPNPALVWNFTDKNVITTKFQLTIEKETATGKEDASGEVSYCDYTITSSGNETFIVSCLPLWVTGSATSLEKKNMPFYSEIEPILRAMVSGNKSVSLSVKVVMKDGTTLNAGDTIVFKVEDFVITIMVEPGDIAKNSYEIDVSANGIIWSPIKVVGHATWRIDVTDTTLFSSNVNSFVNTTCGFTVDSVISFCATLWAVGATTGLISVPGHLNKNDPTSGPISKGFVLTHANTAAALNTTKSIFDTKKTYTVENYNCTDACLEAASAAGLTFPNNCRHNIRFYSSATLDFRIVEVTLPSELAPHL
jgi:hypothetical protein